METGKKCQIQTLNIHNLILFNVENKIEFA